MRSPRPSASITSTTGSTAGDQYTSAIGNDGNDGLTAATPKASIRAILETYNLDAGDIIRIDNGQYDLTTNITILNEDSGVTIEGPNWAGGRAVINRGNTSSTSYAFQLTNADDITLRNLTITGAYYGIYAANGSGSDRLLVERSELTGNSQDGAYIAAGNFDVLFSDNEAYANGNTGIQVEGGGGRVVGNHAWGNAYGIWVGSGGSSVDRIEVQGNVTHDNSVDGISGQYRVLIDGNTSYGNGRYGISAYSGSGDALVSDNEVYRNAAGISLSVGAVGRANRVYANAGIGMELGGGGGAVAEYNIVYDNAIGISESQSRVANNLVYDNRTDGIVAYGVHDSYRGIYNNTIVQPTGNAIRENANGYNIRIRDNILEVG